MFGGKSKPPKQSNGRNVLSLGSSYLKNARNAIGAKTVGVIRRQLGPRNLKEEKKIYKNVINAMQRSLTMEMRNVDRGNARLTNMNNMKKTFNKRFSIAKAKLEALEKRRGTARVQRRGNSPTLTQPNRTTNNNKNRGSSATSTQQNWKKKYNMLEQNYIKQVHRQGEINMQEVEEKRIRGEIPPVPRKNKCSNMAKL